MARPKKNNSHVLLQVVEDFYTENGDGVFAKITYGDLEQYAAEKGLAAKDYDFRRDKLVRERIQELKQIAETAACGVTAAAYASADFDGILSTCASVDELFGKLNQIDQYWKKVYRASVEKSVQNAQLLRDKGNFELEKARLETEISVLRETQESHEKDIRTLRQENAYLRKILRSYLYPELANELLRESGLPVCEIQTLPPAAYKELIEESVPSPFSGLQEAKPKGVTRQEQLLAQMKKQVHGDE